MSLIEAAIISAYLSLHFYPNVLHLHTLNQRDLGIGIVVIHKQLFFPPNIFQYKASVHCGSDKTPKLLLTVMF